MGKPSSTTAESASTFTTTPSRDHSPRLRRKTHTASPTRNRLTTSASDSSECIKLAVSNLHTDLGAALLSRARAVMGSVRPTRKSSPTVSDTGWLDPAPQAAPICETQALSAARSWAFSSQAVSDVEHVSGTAAGSGVSKASAVSPLCTSTLHCPCSCSCSCSCSCTFSPLSSRPASPSSSSMGVALARNRSNSCKMLSPSMEALRRSSSLVQVDAVFSTLSICMLSSFRNFSLKPSRPRAFDATVAFEVVCATGAGAWPGIMVPIGGASSGATALVSGSSFDTEKSKRTIKSSKAALVLLSDSQAFIASLSSGARSSLLSAAFRHKFLRFC